VANAVAYEEIPLFIWREYNDYCLVLKHIEIMPGDQLYPEYQWLFRITKEEEYIQLLVRVRTGEHSFTFSKKRGMHCIHEFYRFETPDE
jgi:hypothetical protein